MLKSNPHKVPPQRHSWFKFLAATLFLLALADLIQAVFMPSVPVIESVILIGAESWAAFVFYDFAKQDEELSRDLHYRLSDTDKRIRDCAEKILGTYEQKNQEGDNLS